MKKYIQPIIIIIILIVLFSLWQRNRTLNSKIKTHQNNIEVLNDTITTIKLRNGDLESSVLGFKANAKELKDYNDKLAKQVKKEKGKVITLNNIVFTLNQNLTDLNQYIDSLQSIFDKPTQINDSLWVIKWTLPYYYNDDNYDIYSGSTYITVNGKLECIKNIKLNHKFTELTNRDSKMTLTWGQKYEDGRVHIFARTSHPAFQAQLLEGTYVDYPKKRHWFTGFGIGPNFTLGYDFVNSKSAAILGIGIQYNIYQW